MNSRVLCQGCRLFKDPAEMKKVGLGYVCNDACMDKVRQRARDKHQRRQDNLGRKSKTTLDKHKRKVRLRDDHRCRWCGRISMLQVHHILYRSQGGTHDLTNLITLCLECHAKAHSNKRLYQPVLVETMRLLYEEGRYLMVPEVMARLGVSA